DRRGVECLRRRLGLLPERAAERPQQLAGRRAARSGSDRSGRRESLRRPRPPKPVPSATSVRTTTIDLASRRALVVLLMVMATLAAAGCGGQDAGKVVTQTADN